MSHRFDCPTDYEARRRGERAFERGDGSWRNPYRDTLGEPHCPEAEQNWQRGYRDAERRAEERAEEERIEQHRLEQRRLEEQWYNEMMEEQYYEQQQQEEQPLEPRADKKGGTL